MTPSEHTTPMNMTSTTQTMYVRRRALPGSEADLAADIDDAIGQLAGGRELIGVALAPISAEGSGADGAGTAGVLVTIVVKEPA